MLASAQRPENLQIYRDSEGRSHFVLADQSGSIRPTAKLGIEVNHSSR